MQLIFEADDANDLIAQVKQFLAVTSCGAVFEVDDPRSEYVLDEDEKSGDWLRKQIPDKPLPDVVQRTDAYHSESDRNR